MERTSISDAEHRRSTASVCRTLADSLGIEGFEMNYLEVEPGETFSTCVHSHPDEEEIFCILEGTATFDTEDGQVQLAEHEVVRFAPKDFQHGYNETDEPVRALTFSAPRDPDVGGVIECPECTERDQPNIETTDSARIIRCTACGAEVSRQT